MDLLSDFPPFDPISQILRLVRISSTSSTPAAELEEILGSTPLDEHRRLRYGGRGPRTALLCGGFTLDGGDAHPIMRALPAALRVRGVAGRPVPWLAATIVLLNAETASDAPGAEEVVSRVADALLSQALRGRARRARVL